MMGFRDSFIDGYLLTPVGPRQRSFAQWSLENTVDSGLRANQKQVQALRDSLTTAFQAGISRLEQSQMQAAKLLQRELQYQKIPKGQPRRCCAEGMRLPRWTTL